MRNGPFCITSGAIPKRLFSFGERWLTFLTVRVGGRDIWAAQPDMPFPTRGMTPFLPGCQIQFNAAEQAEKSLAWQPPPSTVTFLGGRKVTWDNVEAATGQAQLFFSLSFFKYRRSSKKTQKTHRGLISKGGWMPGFEKLLLAFCFLLPFSS